MNLSKAGRAEIDASCVCDRGDELGDCFAPSIQLFRLLPNEP